MKQFTISKNFLGIRFPFRVQVQESQNQLQVYVQSQKPAQMAKHLGNQPDTIYNKLLMVAKDAASQVNDKYTFKEVTGISQGSNEVSLRANFYMN